MLQRMILLTKQTANTASLVFFFLIHSNKNNFLYVMSITWEGSQSFPKCVDGDVCVSYETPREKPLTFNQSVFTLTQSCSLLESKFSVQQKHGYTVVFNQVFFNFIKHSGGENFRTKQNLIPKQRRRER